MKMKKTKLFPVLFALLMLFIFAAPVSAVDLGSGTCIGIGGIWEFDSCTVDGDSSISSSLSIPGGKTLNIAGNLTITDIVIIENAGTIRNVGTISNSGDINNSGTISNNAGGTISNSGDINNSGTISNIGGGIISNSGTINNNAGGDIRNYGTLNNIGSITNWNAITNNGKIINWGTISNSGTISNDFGTIANSCGGYITGIGTISGPSIKIVCVSITTGLGEVKFETSSGNIGNLVAVNPDTLNPDGYDLTYGTFSFNITGINYGSSVTLTLTFPNDLLPGTLYWQYNASSWYSITPDAISGNQMTITLTDGGIEDADGSVNGEIYGSGGPGIPETPVSSGILDATTCSIIGGNWGEPSTCTIEVSSVVIDTDFTIPDRTILNIPVGKMLDINTGAFSNLGTIDNAGSISNNDGTINNTGTINNNGRGTINNSGTIINNFGSYIYNSGTINNKAAGTINNRGSIYNNVGGTINNSGTFSNSNITGTISNSGAINNNGTINNIGSIYNHAGGIIVNNALSYIDNRNSISNNGTISNGGTINNTNLITNSAGGTINNNFGGTLNNTQTITNSGIINNNAGGTINNSDTITNYGTITNKFGSTLTNTGNITNLEGTITNTGVFTNIGIITNYATINNNAGGIISNNADAEIRNWIIINNNAGGTIINSGNINNNGGINNGAISDIGIISDGGTISNIGNITNGNTINNNGDIINSGTIRNTHDIKNYCGGNITGSGTISVYQVISRCIQSSTGNGGVDFLNSAGTIENLSAVNLSVLPPPPNGANLLYGTFTFNITNLNLRGDVTLFLTFPDVLPPGTVYWKYQATHNPQWYSITPDEINGTHMTITLTDGGIGDDDSFANREIYDPGGPGLIPQTQGITTHSASSSGGSGGGGVVSSEPFENIAKYETHLNDLSAGLPKVYSFTSPEIVIYQIIVTGKETVDDVMLRVEALKGTSKLISSTPPGIVYKNLNIFAGSKLIEGASVKFKVENKWLEENNIVPDDINLLKWNGKEWITLDIKEIEKDERFSHFEAHTETFSSFAIVGIQSNSDQPTAVSMTASGVEVTSTEIAGMTSTPVQTKKMPGFEVILGAVALCAVYMFARRR
jgi:PGF-pre-PGF domain-containing protein